MREYGYSSSQVLDITEAISTGLKLSGANAQSPVRSSLSLASSGAGRAEVKNSMPSTRAATGLYGRLRQGWGCA